MFIKICGITTEEDALLSVALGADAVGFIFAPSKRQVVAARVREIVRRLPPEILTVGVFRDEVPERVIDIVNKAGLRAAQLHGFESAEQSQQVKAGVGLVIKAFSAGSRAMAKMEHHNADAILVDGMSPGSGEVFDWSVLDGMNRGQRIILAGGLDSKNVADAIGQVGPWGVDVASGVERSPGHKDPAKLRAFINAARSAKLPEREAKLASEANVQFYDWQQDL